MFDLNGKKRIAICVIIKKYVTQKKTSQQVERKSLQNLFNI